MHPVECDNFQVFHLFVAFRSVQSFWSSIPHFMEQSLNCKISDQGSPGSHICRKKWYEYQGKSGKMSSISRKISGKIREFCPEITVATLCTGPSCILRINRSWCWRGGIMTECYVTKRGYQLECDKPLHRGWGSTWKFFCYVFFEWSHKRFFRKEPLRKEPILLTEKALRNFSFCKAFITTNKKKFGQFH